VHWYFCTIGLWLNTAKGKGKVEVKGYGEGEGEGECKGKGECLDLIKKY
jgi:hypothetical protein